ncbi:MAG: sorbosone dehydrogenase family protein [Bacteroidia bacterium]|nr:sorbosone dehydrogenase family protein [Bacteroidia bacterium]
MNHFIKILTILFLLLSGCLNANLINEKIPPLKKIKLPEGFKIEIFADSVTNARSLARGDNGTIFVGTRSKGNVYALVDADGDFKAEKVYTLATGLNMPNGVAFRNGSLYVAEVDKIWRYDNIESQLGNPPTPVLVFDQLPDNVWHGWKYIAFGPDDKLYIPVGAPCNICLSEEEIYASISRINPDGSGHEIYAHGIRNSVGFAWHPETRDLWFTSNGRDFLGENEPADVLNRAPEPGMHFGFPYCHQGDIPDPKFGEKKPCEEFTPPVQKLNPHGAALGMKFYTGQMFPEQYHNRIFIAEHGSWNRSEPIGYQISMVTLEGNEAVAFEPFAHGWLDKGKAWGRPVDVLILPDGSMLVSDDHADLVYRIFYQP